VSVGEFDIVSKCSVFEMVSFELVAKALAMARARWRHVRRLGLGRPSPSPKIQAIWLACRSLNSDIAQLFDPIV
jgi:hypothetical protein